MSKPPAWAVRKALYAAVALVVAILGWIGTISDVDAGKITAQADQIIPWLLGVLAPALAAAKTHPGSDSLATDEDRVLAAQAHQPAIDPDAVADAVINRWTDATTYGGHADQDPAATTPATRSDITPGAPGGVPTVGDFYRR